MNTLPPKARLLLALPAAASLVCGVLSGLARLGVPFEGHIAGLIGVHGALMIGGFFGTVIGLERAVALGKFWPYAAPLFSGMAGLALIAGAPPLFAQLALCVAALVMTAACGTVWLQQKVAHHATLAVAALSWFAGNLVWMLDGGIVPAVPLWAAFLLLTIAGERLELSRFLPTPPRARAMFALIAIALPVAALLALAAESAGLLLFAAALLALAAWLLRYDIARRTIRTSGLTRYMAACLLSGYLWLAVAAMLGFAGGLQNGSALRDAALHALLLGFVFSMVFGHAPIILPAVSTMKFRWHPGFYLPLALLHLSLAARVLAGLTDRFPLRQQAAVANALTLLLFLLLVVTSLRFSRAPQSHGGAGSEQIRSDPNNPQRSTP